MIKSIEINIKINLKAINEMTVNERIGLIISELRMNKNSFAVKMGVSSTIIHNIVRGRNAPSYDIMYKMMQSFENINFNWLISGEGNMFLDNSEKSVEIGKNQPQNFESTAQNGGTVDTLVAMLAAKDRQMATLISQLTEKDNMINKLLEMIETQKSSPAHTVAKTA